MATTNYGGRNPPAVLIGQWKIDGNGTDARAALPDAVTITHDPGDPDPDPEPAVFECLARTTGTLIVVPSTNTFYDPGRLAANTRYDGRNFHRSRALTGDAAYGLRVRGSAGGCWTGGSVHGTQALNKARDYNTFGNSKAILVGANNQNFLYEGIRIHNWWDAVGTDGSAFNVTFRSCWFTWLRDDMIDNAKRIDGIVFDDCLLDGAFMMYSGRDPATTNRSSRTTTIRNSIHALYPMQLGSGDVASGRPNPGTGYYFKLDPEAPRYDIFDSIFWVQQGASTPKSVANPGVSDNPFYELQEYNKLRNSSGNTIVWGGAGGWPSGWWTPPGFTVTTTDSVYTNAVAAWKPAHPLVYRIPGVDV